MSKFEFVSIESDGTEENKCREISTDEHGFLLLKTVAISFPNISGLTYLENSSLYLLSMDKTRTKFIPPLTGWTNKSFTVISKPKPEVTATYGQVIEAINELRNKLESMETQLLLALSFPTFDMIKSDFLKFKDDLFGLKQIVYFSKKQCNKMGTLLNECLLKNNLKEKINKNKEEEKEELIENELDKDEIKQNKIFRFK